MIEKHPFTQMVKGKFFYQVTRKGLSAAPYLLVKERVGVVTTPASFLTAQLRHCEKLTESGVNNLEKIIYRQIFIK